MPSWEMTMRLLAGTPFDRPPHCDRCDQLESECKCSPETPQSHVMPAGKQTARISTERRKKGKIVTVVQGLSAAANDLPQLLAQLKNACGTGGLVDGDQLELQGDQTVRLKRLLGDLGYKVR